MTETKPIKLKIEGLSEAASKLIIQICNETKCSADEAIVILANRVSEKTAEKQPLQPA